MAYFPNIHIVFLLIVALAHQLYCIEVNEDNIGIGIHGTPARRILYQRSSDKYNELVGTYINVASSGRTFYGLPLHPEQTGSDQPPPWWIAIEIVGRDPVKHRTTLLVRADNGYLVGFRNWTGHDHLLDYPSKDLFPKHTSTMLETGFTYKDLLGLRESREIPHLPLSDDLFDDGARVLGIYPASSRKEMEIALGRFVVMILEGARFKPFRQLISDNWDVGECFIDEQTAKYVNNWATMSLLLFCAQRGIALQGSDAQALKGVGIKTEQDVTNTLGIALVPTRFNPDDPEKSCAPPTKTPPTPEQRKRRNQKNRERLKRRKQERQGQGQGQGH